MLIIPAIDLRDGACVRLTQGRKTDQKIYDRDAVAVARNYQDQGAQMLHVVDLDGAFADQNSRNRQVLLEILRQVNVPVQFGGGLRSLEDVEKVLDQGVQRVVLGTMAVESLFVLKRLCQRFPSRICAGIDAYEGQVLTRGWEKREPVSALELAKRMARAGVERIIYTDVGRDGMLSGVNLQQTRLLAHESGLKVTASGGVASLEDLRQLKQLNEPLVDSVIVGKALLEGRFTLAQAMAAV